MYISHKGIFIRNLSAAFVNSLITLMLLLIAPLGLAAVISNTIAVGISTFVVCGIFDFVVFWLIDSNNNPTFPRYKDVKYRQLKKQANKEIDRRYEDF